jgi:hypothetical protein
MLDLSLRQRISEDVMSTLKNLTIVAVLLAGGTSMDSIAAVGGGAVRGLAVFSSDTDADDWHRHIKPNQIIALAMRRLEALGKGILLLHDIHPATVAALPGLLQQLKDISMHRRDYMV